MPVISSGQITIVDMHDAPSLSAHIGASQTTAQTYNNTLKTWNPNYASSEQVLTLYLTKAGDTKSLLGTNVSGVKWYKTVGNTRTEITSTSNTSSEYKSGTSDSVLTTSKNIPTSDNAVKYSVEGIWTDPYTKLPVNFSATIDLTLVQLAKASIVGNVYAPDGDFFRNNTPASLKINADLYKDGALFSGKRKYKWFAADSSVNTSQDPDAGAGWRILDATTGTTGAVANHAFDVAVTEQGVLRVYPDAVTNAQTFMVVIIDASGGGNNGEKIKQYITLKDLDDPVMTIIDTTNGTVFKNGQGSTTAIPRLFRNGEEIPEAEAENNYVYKWYRWQDSAMDLNFGGTGVAHKTMKDLVIDKGDVHLKTVFKVEVEKK